MRTDEVLISAFADHASACWANAGEPGRGMSRRGSFGNDLVISNGQWACYSVSCQLRLAGVMGEQGDLDAVVESELLEEA